MLRHRRAISVDRVVAIDAADQQALAVPRCQKLERVADAERPAGQHDDAVGVAGGRGLNHGHLADEPVKSPASNRTARHTTSSVARYTRRQSRFPAVPAAVPCPAECIALTSPADDSADSGYRMARSYSTMSSVRLTVRRDAIAVTTAMSAICIAIAI